jgi:hypothetical protein
MSAIVDLLRLARAKIADPQRWTMGTLARDLRGTCVNSSAADAVSFCAIGALHRVQFESQLATDEAERVLRQVAHAGSPEHVNDTFGHTSVLMMYDEAIAFAETGKELAKR